MSEEIKNITGAGGGGKSKKSGSMSEAPNTLRSKAMARGIDLLCEGPIQGLVNGKASIYVDNTPLVYIDSSGKPHENFEGVSFIATTGEPGGKGTILCNHPGFNAIESENAVGVTLRDDGVGVVRSITTDDIDAIRVTIEIPQLYYQSTSDGDINGNSVAIQISTQEYGGAWVLRNIGTEYTETGVAIASNVATYAGPSNGAELTVRSTLPIAGAIFGSKTMGVVEYIVEYSNDGGAHWIVYTTNTVDRSDITGGVFSGLYYGTVGIVDTTVTVSGITEGVNRFRVRLGPGTTAFSNPTRGPSVQLTNAKFSIPVPTHTISGKCMSSYERAFLIPVTGDSPYTIKVRRVTPDSTKVNNVNLIKWKSFTTITYAKLRYPNCALVGVEVDSALFDSIPVRGYDLKLLKVRIPSNYDPVTRNYTGAWNGQFKSGLYWTDNPAWCYYDLITNDRYGLGKYIPDAIIDKWYMYAISQFCDGVDINGNFVGVPSGFGYNEPRFTLNIYIQQRFEAYKLLNDLTSVFRGMSYWAGGTILTTMDAPTPTTAVFNPTNVVDGQFVYAGAAKKARHTVALVAWNNPDNMCRQEVEYVDDPEGIISFGVNMTQVTAVGCTSRGQARRVGKWLLYTEKYESEIITFRTGLDTAFLSPGAVFDVLDPKRSGIQSYGRIAGVTNNTVTLDRSVTLVAGHDYFLTVMLSDGVLKENITVTTGPGTTTTLTISPAFTTLPTIQGVWILVNDDIEPTKWRCVSIREVEPTTFEITGTVYIASKWNYIELEEPLVIPVTDYSPNVVDPPVNVTLTEEVMSYVYGYIGTKLILSWEPPINGFITTYYAEYRVNGGNWIEFPYEDGNSRTLNHAGAGIYEARVCSVNYLKLRSPFVTVTYTVIGMTAPIGDIFGLELDQGGLIFQGKDASFKWLPVLLTSASDFPEEDPTITAASRLWFKDYEVKIYDASNVLLRTEYVTTEHYTYTFYKNYDDTGGHPTRNITISIIARDRWLRVSATPAVITVNNPSPRKIETVLLEAFIGSYNIYITDSCTDIDFENYLIHASQISGFVPNAENLVSRGKAPGIFLNTPDGGYWYVIVAASDSFGEVELNYSDQFQVEVYSTPHAILEQLTIPNIEDDPLYQVLMTQIEGDIVQVDVDNLNAQYTVKINTAYAGGPYITGFGLAAGPPEDPTASEFMILADRFVVVNPNLTTEHAQVFTVHTIDGVGAVGIDGNFIVDGTIHANSIVTSELTVGDGTGGTISMGPLATIAWANIVSTPNNLSTHFTTYIDANGLYTGTLSANTYILGNGTTYGSISTYNYANKSTGIQILDGVTPTINVKGGNITGGTISGTAITSASYIYCASTAYYDYTFEGLNVKDFMTGVHMTMTSYGTCAVYGTCTNDGIGPVPSAYENYGVMGVVTHGIGVYGSGGGTGHYDFYAQSGGVTNYGPFTGAHDAFILGTESIIAGDIVTDFEIINKANISNAIGIVTVTTKARQHSLGIYTGMVPISRFVPGGLVGNEYLLYELDTTGYQRCVVNSLGEGLLNVCKDGGNIQAGDFICSSNRVGKGMKQPDNFLHNYTVAKAREDCIWKDGEDDIRMIACTYHCG